MADYPFNDIEKNWQSRWEKDKVFAADENSGLPPYYILDMFPYPSGAGLHVGHPLGYIASDIIARCKRQQGFEVLHPMGFDAFGLPAEQYAIDSGNHPGGFTDKNIDRYREQLKMLALSFDWDREVKTSDPKFYKWTQWIFIQLFNSWYNHKSDKAEDIQSLISIFEKEGNKNIVSTDNVLFTAAEWNNYSDEEKQKTLLGYRMAYIGESEVNWCEALGTVLANEEVKDGFSERGGYPVIRKKMQQWFLRITAYADRLLSGLEEIDWPEPVKEMQRNWIGKSVGAEVKFALAGSGAGQELTIFTTRPDTIFGCTFMVLAPEHPVVKELTTPEYIDSVNAYIDQASRKSDRERMAEVKKVSGVFTGGYAINPFTNKQIPVWIADYVLADYGTGAIMAVPGHDSRDWAFARHFNLPVVEVVAGGNIEIASHDAKDGKLINSGFLDGLEVKQAIIRAIEEIESLKIGHRKVNFRLRDANFSRQRYWGEPFPVIYKNGLPYILPLSELPVELPEVESYKPTGSGESPLAALHDWVNHDSGKRETNTMPGWAGSSWYFLRYMDPHNDAEFVSKEREAYWKNVDFYVGGSEHATGHLLYSRFWHKFLFDRGLVSTSEPFKKMINQGMIQGVSAIAYRLSYTMSFSTIKRDLILPSVYVTKHIADKIQKGTLSYEETDKIKEFCTQKVEQNYQISDVFEFSILGAGDTRVAVNLVHQNILDKEGFKNWLPHLANSYFYPENEDYICGSEVEKMSKSKYNVVNPDEIIQKYGCDTFRMYEMFLGPIEQSKPWDTNGIEGVSRFLRKFWNLFFNEAGEFSVSTNAPTPEELKILHKTIKKVTDDIDRFSLNTCISSFMVCTNELYSLKCNKTAILDPLVRLIAPFAPHIADELWSRLGNQGYAIKAAWPQFEEKYLLESTFEYPVSINGKLRTKIELALELNKDQVESEIRLLDLSRWTEGKELKKVIVVPGKIVNIVV